MLLRGGVQLKRLAWNGNQVEVTLLSGTKQQVQLQLPKNISSLKTVAGNAGKLSPQGRTATLNLPANQEVKLQILQQ